MERVLRVRKKLLRKRGGKEDKMARPLLTGVLTPTQLKKLRDKPFLERNKIIQDKLNKKQKEKLAQLRKEGKR